MKHDPDLTDAWLAREASRRSLLKAALATAAAAAVGVSCKGAVTASEPSPEPGNEAPKHATDALVGLGGGDDVVAALDRALAFVGGLDFIGKGDTIYFKVNCNSGDRYPHSTNPALITALAKRCRDHGAKRIIVGDRSFWGDGGTLENLEENGIADAAAEVDAELMAFEEDNVEWVQFDEANVPDWVDGFRVPKPVVDADHIINLPCVKTHFIAHFTMSLKNGFGLIHPHDRSRSGNLLRHDKTGGKLWRQIAQVNQVYTPSLNILDGFQALITGGPNKNDSSTYADPRVIIASRDRIAADLLGVAVLQTLSPDDEAVMSSTAWSQPQIQYAVEAGVGLKTLAGLTVEGDEVALIDTYRKLASAV